jgi:hypothetical protein
MSSRTRALPAAVTLGALLLAAGLAACSPESIIENAIEDKTGVRVDDEGDSVTITGDDGSVTEFNEADDGWVTITGSDGSVYTQGEGIPADFPSAVPLIDMPTTFGVSSVDAEGVQVFMLTMESAKGCDGVFDDVVSRLADKGYTEEQSSTVMESSDGYWALGSWVGAYKVTVSVSDNGGATCNVSYTVESIQG